MNQRDKILLTVVAVVGVLAAGWFGLVAPKRDEATQLDAQIATARTNLAGSASRLAQYRAARTSLLKHPAALRESDRALPTRADMPDLLRQLTKTAEGANVDVGDITAGSGATDPSNPGIGTVGLQLNFTGGYVALQKYLAKLHKFVAVRGTKVDAKGRLMSLDTIQLGRGDNGGLAAKVGATVYVLQAGALTATPTPTTGATAAPATTATPAPASASASASTPTTAGGTQ
jgi:Tfp pilus assembly protein PilO